MELLAERDTTTAVLTFARTQRALADQAERDLLVAAVEWASMHSTDSVEDAAYYAVPGADEDCPIAGDGAPWITEFCIAEFAAAINLPTEHGKTYLAQAVELRHRLPRVWARVQAGDLVAWRARRIAEHTLHLSLEAAAYVDRWAAPRAHKIGSIALTRLVDAAIARFMPAEAEARALAALENRSFEVHDHRVSSLDATVTVFGTVDLADAMDLQAAITRIARDLKTAGSEDSLDVRRSKALGILARGGHTLDGEPITDPGKQVTLHIHLRPHDPVDTSSCGDDGFDPVAHLNQLDPVLLAQVKTWCADGHVTVTPVVDLNQILATDAYQPTTALAEQIRLRDPVCVFPHCQRPARRRTGSLDGDHIQPWADGGPTASHNLAPLCRLHHRLKTHGGWTYQMHELGTFVWASPHGQRFRTHGIETERLPDRPVDVPGSHRPERQPIRP